MIIFKYLHFLILTKFKLLKLLPSLIFKSVTSAMSYKIKFHVVRIELQKNIKVLRQKDISYQDLFNFDLFMSAKHISISTNFTFIRNVI